MNAARRLRPKRARRRCRPATARKPGSGPASRSWAPPARPARGPGASPSSPAISPASQSSWAISTRPSPTFAWTIPTNCAPTSSCANFAASCRRATPGRGPACPTSSSCACPTITPWARGPAPEASVADNDLAVGRVVEAVSHSPYWSDTAIVILEDDAQDGADHVDAHRSLCLVISKYSPSSEARPFVDHHFYTTVNAIRTMEVLLGLPPMNHNDARAAVMAPLFSGAGDQAPFDADFRNRDNGLIYRMNPARGPGARASAAMDWRHADANPAAALNAILWRERKGNTPEPAPRYTVPGLDAPPAGASR